VKFSLVRDTSFWLSTCFSNEVIGRLSCRASDSTTSMSYGFASLYFCLERGQKKLDEAGK